MANPKFSLIIILGLSALMIMSLLSLTEARPNYLGGLGKVVGPHQFPLDDLGIIIGPHTHPDDLETVIDTDFKDFDNVTRREFPPDFLFGTSVSAFQVEGAKHGRGRGLTSWDEFTHMFADKVDRKTDGDVAIDFFNRYKDDIKLMKDLNTNAFRFSIAWTRIFPYGRKETGVNRGGVQFYHDLIDELIANDITPLVTLFHWESPLALEMEYKGFLDRKIIEDFRAFARFCFEEYGHRVKNWATFNEPSVYSVAGYSKGKKAPGRCSPRVDKRCIAGDSAREPYIVAHNEILAHLAAVEEFKKCSRCQEGGGKIGIVVVSHWFEPLHDKSEEDKLAVVRSLEFMLGWFMHPLTHGDYPKVMKQVVGNRLPKFTPQESQRLRDNPLDFVGLNYYGMFFATHNQEMKSSHSYDQDMGCGWKPDENNLQPHLKNTSKEIYVYPPGLRNILKYIKINYKDPEIYIMENGMDEFDNGTKTEAQALDDYGRAEFVRSHIMIVAKSIRSDHVKVKGYFVWSLVDNFEWQDGYDTKFGLYRVDYNNGLERKIKESGKWLKQFLSYKLGPLDLCYFEKHRKLGHPPPVFGLELYEPDEDKRYTKSYVSDFM